MAGRARLEAVEVIVQVGLCHRTASGDELGRLHASRETARPEAAAVRSVPVATCHRLELYVEGVTETAAVAAWRDWLGLARGAPRPGGLAVRRDNAAGRHLLRVAAGLESAVLGEDQVLAQLRAAYRDACAAGTAGPLLHRLFHAAFRAGRRVRSETALAGGSRSLSAAAVNCLDRQLGELPRRRVLVVGCGTMGALAARRLAERHTGEILVANRTWSRAAALAAAVGGRAVPWPWRQAALRECDAVVAAASGEVISEAALVAAATVGRLRLALDLGMPGNIAAPGPLPPGLALVDLAGLAARLDEAQEARAAAVRSAERIVDEELATWWEWAVARGTDRGRRRGGVATG